MDSLAIAVINFKDSQVHLSFGVSLRDDVTVFHLILSDESARLLPPTTTTTATTKTTTLINAVTVNPSVVSSSRESRFIALTTMHRLVRQFQPRPAFDGSNGAIGPTAVNRVALAFAFERVYAPSQQRMGLRIYVPH